MINADGHICLRPSMHDTSTMSLQSRYYNGPEYVAPEILKGECHGKPADMWSFGVMIFEMLTGLPPFYSKDLQQHYKQILESNGCPHSMHVHGDALTLLNQLLVLDPNKRLSDFSRVKSHAFFAAIDWDSLLRKEVLPPFIPPITHGNTPEPDFILPLSFDEHPVDAADNNQFADFVYFPNTSL